MATADEIRRLVLPSLHSEWQALVVDIHSPLCPAFEAVCHQLSILARVGTKVVPSYREMCRVLAMPASAVRVVVLGQDPYTKVGQATGLAFSNYVRVASGRAKSTMYAPSLDNILEASHCRDPTLFSWFGQGVFLSNTIWTATVGQIGTDSAHNFWKPFVDAVLEHICRIVPGVSALLWGLKAQQYGSILINGGAHTFTYHHPSPLADSGVLEAQRWKNNPNFRDVNSALVAAGRKAINWTTRPFQYSWPKYLVFTDGGCVDNGKASARAGFGLAILVRQEAFGARLNCTYVVEKHLSAPIVGAVKTNNVAELTAIKAALSYPKYVIDRQDPFGGIAIVTDSGYSINVLLGIFNINENAQLISEIVYRQELWRPIYAHVRGHAVKVPPAEMPTRTDDYDAFFGSWNAKVDTYATAGIPVA